MNLGAGLSHQGQVARPQNFLTPDRAAGWRLSMNDTLLNAIRNDSEIRALLGDTFDFYLIDSEEHFDWFTLDGVSERRIIAKKGSGCAFLLFGGDDRLGFVSSEGRAGIIAASLAEGLSLIVAHPYWESLVAENVEIMREGVEDEEDSLLDDFEDADEHRAIVRERLGLPEMDDPLAALHRAITTLGKDFVARPLREPDVKFEPLLRRHG
jgi:hypothetical protein